MTTNDRIFNLSVLWSDSKKKKIVVCWHLTLGCLCVMFSVASFDKNAFVLPGVYIIVYITVVILFDVLNTTIRKKKCFINSEIRETSLTTNLYSKKGETRE